MDFTIARGMIGVIKNERQSRLDRLKNEDQDFAYDQWSSSDEPFINDMCLMVLIALRHQVERELVLIAARADVGRSITRKQYHENVANQRKKLGGEKGWLKLDEKLRLSSFAEWKGSMESLRLLANCLKHESSQQPDEKLLKHLKLPAKPAERFVTSYLPVAESGYFRQGLAESINLAKDADYCVIAETFVDLAGQFVENVRQKTSLAQITSTVSLVDFAG
jgi:hypothetical protein